MDFAKNLAAGTLNKVPQVTLAFWAIKIMSTTVGETGADYLAVHAGLGTAVILDQGESTKRRSVPLPSLLETMLRALSEGPAQFERVAALLDVLRKAPNSSELLSAEFQAVWEPIWDTAKRGLTK